MSDNSITPVPSAATSSSRHARNDFAAQKMLPASGINPNNLGAQQFQNFANAPPAAQQEAIATYAQILQQNHGGQMGGDEQMPKPGGPRGPGSPMLAQGPDGTTLTSFYYPNDMVGPGGIRVGPNGPQAAGSSNHALEDHQMQLMLLEQQNKKRLPREQDALHPKIHYTISQDEIGMKPTGIKPKSDCPQSTSVTTHSKQAKPNQKAYISHTDARPQTFYKPNNMNHLGLHPLRQPQLYPFKPSWQKTDTSPSTGLKPNVYESSSGLDDLSVFNDGNNINLEDLLNSSSLELEPIDQIFPHPDNNLTSNLAIDSLENCHGFDCELTNEISGRPGEFEQTSGIESTQPLNMQMIANLVEKIQLLENEKRKTQEDQLTIKVQVFHVLGEGKKRFYLSEPFWEVYDAEISLAARQPVFDPVRYVEKQGNIAFTIYKHYKKAHQRGKINEAKNTMNLLPSPDPVSQKVELVSDEMKTAVSAFFSQHPGLKSEFPELQQKNAISSPYIWWYHCRKSHNIQNLSPRQAELVFKLTNWIEAEYGTFYEQIEDQFRRGLVTSSSIKYLIRPGQILVSNLDGTPKGHLVMNRPTRRKEGKTPNLVGNEEEELEGSPSWSIRTRAYCYSGSFLRFEGDITIDLNTKTPDEEVDIASLDVTLLRYVSPEVQEKLLRRGKTFWKCRNRRFVSYEGRHIRGKQTRFMIDFDTYKDFHPKNSYLTKASGLKADPDLPRDGSEPKAPEIYIFPTLIPGFDLRRKKWVDLEVDQIRDVDWNKQAFDSLVADKGMKEIVYALVTNQLEAQVNTDLIESKGNGLIMLLHGPPGTGKTFTAESVAEIARKPLYPVTCGDIGTQPEAVEEYLEMVFYLGNIWDCVVLLDEAEVFLEQRTLQDLNRNALVSVFLRALEYYDGILILTTNRVGTFDEAFKSRIQLALHYKKLEVPQREQIWKNFMHRLEELGEHDNIDFRNIDSNIGELAQYPMNGRQIRNLITTGRQLAKFKKTQMKFTHLKQAIEVAAEFEKYLDDVREADVEGFDGKGDEFYARSDFIR